ncbi:MAG TPA: hypothetical protein OIM34_00925 [Ruminococcus bromii]|nr:hypothetical protein [Ruminococcus bromii]
MPTIINSIEQLMQFLNDKGVLEIAQRRKDQKFKEFQNVIIDPSLLNRAQEQIQNEIKKALNINNDLIKSSLSKINAVTCLSSVGIILEAVNLCATCAGFIIMFEKLKKISGKVDALVNTVKSSNQIQTNFELNKILSEHANMLDSRKTKNDYSEEKMRILVDDEFNVLKMLIDTFLLETTNERNNLVLSIYSLASMLTVSIMYFDELYYYNNKDRISNGEYWHSSHNRWMSELDRLSSAEFISKIQDFGFLELNLSTFENDEYYICLLNQARDLIQEINDNQSLIQAFDSDMDFKNYNEITNQTLKDEINEAFKEANVNFENNEIADILNDAFKKVGIS